jgi:hypothetical protein
MGAGNGKGKAKGKGKGVGLSVEEVEALTKEMAFTALVPPKEKVVEDVVAGDTEEKGEDAMEEGGAMESEEDGDGLGKEVRVTLVTSTKTEEGFKMEE